MLQLMKSSLFSLFTVICLIFCFAQNVKGQNKITGKVILNRSQFRSFGDVDLSDVKIIARNWKGEEFSALTNDKGEYLLRVSFKDSCIVRINNVFYEHFAIKQEEFIVDFTTGEKCIVDFVFYESKRLLNSLSIDDDTIKSD